MLWLIECLFNRSKKRAKDNNVISSENTKFTGELYRKGLLSWTKCYCILTNQALVCYRAGKDSKVLVKIPTSGHEFTYLEKDGKNSHVIRISHPGSEVHWFYADSKETAEMWQMVGTLRPSSAVFLTDFCQLKPPYIMLQILMV